MARHRGNEGRAQRDLGLAEADIAADQPVHRPARGEIGERVLDRARLVLGLRVREARAEFGEQPLGRLHRVAVPEPPLGRDADQGMRDLGDAPLDPRFALLPADAAEFVERRARFFRSEARQHVDVFDRHEEPVVVGIGKLQAVMRCAARGDRDQPLETADAMVDMHHEIAGRQRRRLGDEVLGAHAAPGGADQALAEDVLFADDDKVVALDPAFEPQNGHADAAWRQRGKFCEGRHGLAVGAAMLREQGLQPVARAGAVAGHHNAAPATKLGEYMIANRVEDVGAGLRLRTCLGEALPQAPAEIPTLRAFARRGEGRERCDGLAAQALPPFLRRQIEAVRQERPIGRPIAVLALREFGARGIGLVDLLDPGDQGLVGLMVERHDRVGRVVEKCLEAAVEQRQPMLESAIAASRADRLVERIGGASRPEQFPIAGAESFDGRGIEQDLADRLEGEQTQPVRADLRRRIEPAYRLERVADQVEPQRLLGCRRKDVDAPAPQRVFAWFAHGVAAHVAVAGEEARQRLERDALADDRAKTAGGEHFPWRHALQHRVDGRHHDPALARPRGGSPGEFGERGYAAADDIADRRDAVIGQAIPGGEIENRQARREERQGLDDLRAARRLAGDMQHRAAGRSRRRDGTGIEPRRYACQFGALARRQGRKIGHDAMSAAKRRSRAITALSCSAGTDSRPIAQA